MPAWLVVVLYVVAILLVVLIHEAGHFATAKAFKIRVEEFFVGFGPRLWSFRRGETEYGLKALPFGGYVRIAGMNPFEEIPESERARTFGSKPAWQRAIVIATGPVTHFVIAILLLAGFFALIGQHTYRPEVAAVCAVNPGSPRLCPARGRPSPAELAGLRKGDVIVAVDGHRDISGDALHAYTETRIGRRMTLVVRRGTRLLTFHATPRATVEDGRRVGRLGVIIEAGPVLSQGRSGPITAFGKAGAQAWTMTKAVVARLGNVFGPTGLKRIWQLLAGTRQRSDTDVGSVVAGGQLVADAAQAGAWDALIWILAAFNLFIGIMNLIPLPPLDGGHLAVIAYEKIRRRRPDVRKLVPLTALVAGFMILFAMSVMYLDIVHPLPNPFQR
jgi:membrane-associated protease RseP (regulator of RpoE activity)